MCPKAQRPAVTVTGSAQNSRPCPTSSARMPPPTSEPTWSPANNTAPSAWPRHGTLMGAVPCTRPARILVECAELLGHEELCELVDEVLCRRLTTVDGVHQAMARAGRSPGRKGLIDLERALEVWTPGPRPGSPAEMRLARCLVRWGFPPPQRQVKIHDGRGGFVARVDLGWPKRRVGLEYE